MEPIARLEPGEELMDRDEINRRTAAGEHIEIVRAANEFATPTYVVRISQGKVPLVVQLLGFLFEKVADGVCWVVDTFLPARPDQTLEDALPDPARTLVGSCPECGHFLAWSEEELGGGIRLQPAWTKV